MSSSPKNEILSVLSEIYSYSKINSCLSGTLKIKKKKITPSTLKRGQNDSCAKVFGKICEKITTFMSLFIENIIQISYIFKLKAQMHV